jgi:DNA invertase Pin-like site-specific DNA recombinase
MGYVGYVRVSRRDGREGDSFQSPDEQKRKIEAWAKLRGVEIDRFAEDIDVSGGTLSRPALDTVLSAIAAGAVEGIAVAKLDRLSRAGVADALKLVEQIHADGGSIAAVDLGIDPKTDFGEFGMTIMLALARMERRRLSDSWVSARTNAVQRGAFVGPTPIGFVRGDGSRLVPDEKDTAPLVRELFAISGEGGLEAALEFGRLTWPDRFWSPTQLRKILASRVYRGDIQSGNIIAREVIEPLVSEDVWYAAQHEPPPARAGRQEYPLSGIARCANCGGPMVGHHAGRVGSQKRGYRCNGKGCTKRPHVYAEPLEEIVLEGIRATAHRWVAADADLPALERARTDAQTELESYVVNASVRDPELFQKGLDARQDTFTAAQQAYNAAREAMIDMPDLDSPTADDLRRMIASLTVQQGRTIPLPDRVSLQLVGDES